MEYEDKIQKANEIIKDFNLGFIMPTELILQVLSIPWNPLEKRAILHDLNKAIQIDFSELKTNWG